MAGGSPFVTDTNTLYTGMRKNAVDNIRAAAMNGFSLETLTAPVIVADGLLGHDYREVQVSGTIVEKAKIASAILDADAMIVLSHVKSHMVFGFGGALKNLGMGCSAPAGKQFLHSDLLPEVDAKACKGDGHCLARCPQECIELIERPEGVLEGVSRRIARIDQQRCIGCGECTATCPHKAIPIRWKTSPEAIMHKTAEYALASVSGKRDKVGYINCLVNITPDCDCCNWNEPAFVPDVGFTSSLDPVAIDTASADLVSRTPPSPGGKADGCQGDPWRAVRDTDYRETFAHAERIGLGTREYELVRL